MQMRLVGLCLFLLIASPSFAARKARETGSSPEMSRGELINRGRRSLVEIVRVTENGEVVREGTGFVVAPGLVATAAHVVNWSTDRLRVLPPGVTQPSDDHVAELVASNWASDTVL